MFLDKDDHLKKLNHLYEENPLFLVSLYSDPGMGKTTLLRAFCANRNFLYFKPLETTEQENFAALKEAVFRVTGPFDKLKEARRFPELFRVIGRYAKEHPLIFILDDFPHLTDKNKRLSTLIHSYMKKEWKDSGLFVVLCKPASLFEKEKDPDAVSFVLKPFTFFETRQLFRHLPVEDQICIYGITGGVPGYMKYFINDLPFRDNLFQLFFTTEGVFYKRPPRYLKILTEHPENAHSALLCLKNKKCKLHEICERTGLTPSAAGSLMNSLILSGIVNRIIPVTESTGSRRTMYEISDSVFRFWYAYAAPWRNQIEMGAGREPFEKEVLPQLDSYAKDIFEDVCRQYLDLLVQKGKAPFSFTAAGSWWGQHPTKKRTKYVPIAAADDNNILLGDCFWTDQWIDLDGLSSLQKHAGLFPHTQKWYCLFAKSDFISGMETMYGDTMKVFTLDEMCRYADTVIGA